MLNKEFDYTKIAQCHKSVMVFRSNLLKTKQTKHPGSTDRMRRGHSEQPGPLQGTEDLGQMTSKLQRCEYSGPEVQRRNDCSGHEQ
jgi:hypothetical protein